MKLKIRDIEMADVPIVTSIIGAHDERDGLIATEYYEGYLKDQVRISSPKERNVVGILDEQLVSCPMNKFKNSLDLLEDRICRRGPHERS